MIVTAFAEGNRKMLKDLLSKEVMEGFNAAITDREQRGEVIDQSFVGINKADIVEAELKSGSRDRHRQVREPADLGDPRQGRRGDRRRSAEDHRRHGLSGASRATSASRNPNWKLVATAVGGLTAPFTADAQPRSAAVTHEADGRSVPRALTMPMRQSRRAWCRQRRTAGTLCRSAGRTCRSPIRSARLARRTITPPHSLRSAARAAAIVRAPKAPAIPARRGTLAASAGRPRRAGSGGSARSEARGFFEHTSCRIGSCTPAPHGLATGYYEPVISRRLAVANCAVLACRSTAARPISRTSSTRAAGACGRAPSPTCAGRSRARALSDAGGDRGGRARRPGAGADVARRSGRCVLRARCGLAARAAAGWPDASGSPTTARTGTPTARSAGC